MADLQDFEQLVAQMPDELPFLLFPVRIETRFMNVGAATELWIRIFPDDIAVHTHEEALTPDEVKLGEAYWQEVWQARQLPAEEKETKDQIEKGAWRALATAVGGGRANWIAGETVPPNLETAANREELIFGALPGKEESWSQAPRSKIMPDHFIAVAYQNGVEIFRALGNPIPNPLILGPDPQTVEEEFQQINGELVVGEAIQWIYDFEKAVASGMGFKINLSTLSPPFDGQQIDRLLVLGVRLSTNPGENKALVEALFENHKFSPDGMSLLRQGTPTNNTEGSGSGYSSVDPGAERSFAGRSEDVPFSPSQEANLKSDRQRLAEALGIEYGTFQGVENGDQHEVSQAMGMNKALWHGTLGYYLEEMLGVDLRTVERIRELFTDFVTARGPLPAIRVGSQPYGVLLTSDFTSWTWSQNIEGGSFSLLDHLVKLGRKIETKWQELLPSVANVDTPGDPHQNLLTMLGLHATSVEFHRRHAVGIEYLWNYALFLPRNFVGIPPVFEGFPMFTRLRTRARSLLADLGVSIDDFPKLLNLVFFSGQDEITDPLVDDIPAEETEKLSEDSALLETYSVKGEGGEARESNYIGWLARSSFEDIRRQNFRDKNDARLPIPRPLLYRMLRGALLQSFYDAAMRWYQSNFDVPPAARREIELGNMRSDSIANRTVTRWEFLDAKLSALIPGGDPISIGELLRLERSGSLPEALSLGEVYDSLSQIENLSTAQLERLFVEHLDLCSYRLDAWQMGCFNRRLLQQRLGGSNGPTADRKLGLYLGAFGWVENLQPAELLPVVDADIPLSLHDPDQDGPLFEQPDNGGFIHGPSLNHAVTAAVLRSAYLTHRDTDEPLKMAVNLSSERVRIALSFLEGIRNGQELGALLGYQFERGLHERYGDRELNQFIPMFRQKYPLVADKITPDDEGGQIETKEARNVFDGYALLEKAFLRKKENRLAYPYGVKGLPDTEGLPEEEWPLHARYIKAEVKRMADTFDAIADVALAEGVFQAAQGNYDRAGSIMQAITEGNSPIEPEIVRTPRSGAQFTQRVVLHLETENPSSSPWPGELSPRAKLEPGLNNWLGSLLPTPENIAYSLQIGDQDPLPQSIDALALQPIDLVYLIADDLANEATEIESRIAYENRGLLGDDGVPVQINFMPAPSLSGKVTLFELLPLLRILRKLVTGSSPLTPDDFRLPSLVGIEPGEDTAVAGYDFAEVDGRLDDILISFEDALDALKSAIPTVDANGERDLSTMDAESVRNLLRALADFGVPDTIPVSLVGSSDSAKSMLLNQADNTISLTGGKPDKAKALIAMGGDTNLPEDRRIGQYQEAAREILGGSFNLIPLFGLRNQSEVLAATAFRDADQTPNLTRYHADNPFLVEEWLQGIAPVREHMANVESTSILSSALGADEIILRPLQLPFRETDHWVAMEYPEVRFGDEDEENVFVPEGEFLSLVQWLPGTSFNPSQQQSGLLIDEWVEVIPSKGETTGIAIHYDQPSTEPPQALLLAVTPELTGQWTVDELIGILNNTFDRAKLRAVEPDHLGNTALGQLVPAIISAVTSRPFATISTDYVHQTAVNPL